MEDPGRRCELLKACKLPVTPCIRVRRDLLECTLGRMLLESLARLVSHFSNLSFKPRLMQSTEGLDGLRMEHGAPLSFLERAQLQAGQKKVQLVQSRGPSK